MFFSVPTPHGDMGVVPNHLLTEHLHMDVGVIKMFPHLPQLTHSKVQAALSLTPAGDRQRKSNVFLKRLTTQLFLVSISAFMSVVMSPVCPSPTLRSVLLLLAEEGQRLRLGVAGIRESYQGH